MSDDANPLEDAVEQALDAFLYAPIGLVFEGPALFPTLVDKGRNQVKVARMMGEMAVQMGQTKATEHVKTAQEQMRGPLAAMGLVPTTERPGDESGDDTRISSTTTAKRSAAKKPATVRKGAAKHSATTATPKPEPEGLGIPDYDSLSASQVVSRLRGLAPGELEKVRDYESATRARKTILNKITQLQKD
ncbi:MAG: hypothetical protein U5K30_15365 [Acidimicrobiales bacterium]|nr:hypothetical protein [Acidimicrobiales bacterium]